MENAETILIIILSSVLSLFLILSIVAAVLVIKVLRSVKRVTEKAEKVVDSAEAVGEAFKHASGPLALMKLVRNIVEMTNKISKR